LGADDDAEVTGGPSVGAAEGEQEIDFGAPRADAGKRGEHCADFVIFAGGEKVERATIDKREMQLLYHEGENLVFMDNESYDQITVPPEVLGDAARFLVEGSVAVMLMHGAEIVGTDLPAAVELAIAETEPGIQGDRVSGATKPAKLETGLVVQVPLFVSPGERVKVDTRSGTYIARA